MDAISYIHLEFAALHERAVANMIGLTDEHLNWAPPGTANKIGVILLHAISGEDLFIQQFLQDKSLVWDSQCWAEKFGITYRPGGSQGWDEASQARLKLSMIMQYQQAVVAEIDGYLARLSPEELDRKVTFFGHELPVALLLTICLFHTSEHMGEIGALRGVMNTEVNPGK